MFNIDDLNLSVGGQHGAQALDEVLSDDEVHVFAVGNDGIEQRLEPKKFISH